MGVFLQSAVEPLKVHETSWMVYTALIIQNEIWIHFKTPIILKKKSFFLYTQFLIPWQVNFSEKKFFMGHPIYCKPPKSCVLWNPLNLCFAQDTSEFLQYGV